jgi:hypothetical protein
MSKRAWFAFFCISATGISATQPLLSEAGVKLGASLLLSVMFTALIACGVHLSERRNR